MLFSNKHNFLDPYQTKQMCHSTYKHFKSTFYLGPALIEMAPKWRTQESSKQQKLQFSIYRTSAISTCWYYSISGVLGVGINQGQALFKGGNYSENIRNDLEIDQK